MKPIRFVLGVLLCLAAAGAQAQWQWIDKEGRRVFSDRGPPPDIPAKNILKQPGGAKAPGSAVADAAAPAARPASDAAEGQELPAPKLSATDRDLAEKKKQAEAAAAAKTKAEEERFQKAKAENCERARANKVLVDSGVRMAQTDAKGERVILDDAARAAELKRIQVVIDTSCK